MKYSRAFTMIELVFVIVVLGILAAVALPKFSETRNQADIAKGRADVATIRTAIANERQSRVILGDATYITKANLNNASGLFGGVLTYAITDSNTDGNWHATGTSGEYSYKIDGVSVIFNYYDSTEETVSKRGTFGCDTTNATYGEICKKLVNA